MGIRARRKGVKGDDSEFNNTHREEKGVAGNVFNESQLALDKRLNSCISQSNIS